MMKEKNRGRERKRKKIRWRRENEVNPELKTKSVFKIL